VPTLCRLEYLTPAGWVVGHADVNLLDPQRYVERLATKGVPARVVELEDMRPSGVVHQPGTLPPPTTRIPLARVVECSDCGGAHDRAWSCLL